MPSPRPRLRLGHPSPGCIDLTISGRLFGQVSTEAVPSAFTGPFATSGIAVQLKSPCMGLLGTQEELSRILDIGLFSQGYSAYCDQQPQLPSHAQPLLAARCLISASRAESTKTSSC